jgi:hypothetical protein
MTDSRDHPDDSTTVHVGRFQDAPIGAAVKRTRGVRWRRMVIFFMRLCALVWLIKGLLQWTYILGITDSGFPDLRLSRQGIVMAFAVLDLVSAVGLWLVSSWGAAVWLMVLAAEAVIPFMVPDMTRPVTDAVASLVFGAIYLVLVWQAIREEETR